MSAAIIDGKLIARDLRVSLRDRIKEEKLKPGLAVILVGDDPASQVYVSKKITTCQKVGIESYEYKLGAESTEKDVKDLINKLNGDPLVHGILLQLPLPDHLADVQESLVQRISPDKDVDGLTTTNAGKLFLGIKGGFVPCTPQGSLLLIKSVTENLSGKNAVVIGRSNLFGKPMAQLLLQENCTVTTAHSRTKNLGELCKTADILIAAVGQREMVKANWVKEGAIVIDVGVNRLEDGKLCGDVDYDAVSEVARAITPVPGGVGPMTIACLLSNTIQACKNAKN